MTFAEKCGEVVYGITAILGIALTVIALVFRIHWIAIVAVVSLLVALSVDVGIHTRIKS